MNPEKVRLMLYEMDRILEAVSRLRQQLGPMINLAEIRFDTYPLAYERHCDLCGIVGSPVYRGYREPGLYILSACDACRG